MEKQRANEPGVHHVRNLRAAAATLADTADRHRETLIQELGLKRYIYNALGEIAHRPADGCQLEWPDRVEPVIGVLDKLGDYLHARARREQRLPQAVVTKDDKYYL